VYADILSLLKTYRKEKVREGEVYKAGNISVLSIFNIRPAHRKNPCKPNICKGFENFSLIK